jgi:hypothetical protein
MGWLRLLLLNSWIISHISKSEIGASASWFVALIAAARQLVDENRQGIATLDTLYMTTSGPGYGNYIRV